MFKFKKNSKKTVLGISLVILIVSSMNAFSCDKKSESKPAKIKFSATIIKPLSDKNGTLLKGDVELSINNKIKISADNVLVQYTDKAQKQISEFIIYGKGLLTQDNHSMQFVNGTFYLNTQRLSAEEIKKIS